MKKNRPTLILVIIILALALTSCSDKQPEFTYAKGAGKDAEAYFLRNREVGSCSTLTGAVNFTAVFVSDADSSWKTEDVLTAMTNLQSALDVISAEAEMSASDFDE